MSILTCLPLLRRPRSRFTFFCVRLEWTGGTTFQHASSYDLAKICRKISTFATYKMPFMNFARSNMRLRKRMLAEEDVDVCLDNRLNKWSDCPSISLLLWERSPTNRLLPLPPYQQKGLPLNVQDLTVPNRYFLRRIRMCKEWRARECFSKW